MTFSSMQNSFKNYFGSHLVMDILIAIWKKNWSIDINFIKISTMPKCMPVAFGSEN